MVAKNDIATTARPPAAMTRTRPKDDRMADCLLVVGGGHPAGTPAQEKRPSSSGLSRQNRFYTRACQTAKGWLQRRAILRRLRIGDLRSPNIAGLQHCR